MGAGAARDGVLPGGPREHEARSCRSCRSFGWLAGRAGLLLAGRAGQGRAFRPEAPVWLTHLLPAGCSPATLPQPQDFIDAVLKDRLASLFALLERRAPGQRPYLLVCGLAAHMLKTHRQKHKADMQAGVVVRTLHASGDRICSPSPPSAVPCLLCWRRSAPAGAPACPAAR